METALQLDAVMNLLESGQTVVVPGQAAAGDLRRHFNLRQQASGRRVWEPPCLFSWEQWLDSLWNVLTLEGIDSRVVLNRLQEESLWAELAAPAGLSTLPSSTLRALARQASSGLALAASFHAVDRLGSTADSPDSRVFAAWYRLFESHCQAHHLLPRALLASVLTEHLRADRLAAPSVLNFVGFERWNLAQTTLLEALQQSETTVHLRGLRRTETEGLQGSGVIAGDLQAELRWAVLWLRQHFTANPNPRHPAALVLPDPGKERAQLEPLLRELLAPELEPVAQDLSSTPWHFSSGHALASQTMIAHALQLLRWTQGELSTNDIGALLLSPYLAHADPFEQRARFETQTLRKVALLRPEMTLTALLKFAAKTGASKDLNHAGALTLPEWRTLETLLAKTPRSVASHGEWAEHFRKLLHTAGWPGCRTLSPAEFRLNEAWNSALDLLSTLDLFGKRVNRSDFLTLLTAEVQRIEAQGANPGAVVQILRPSETEGRLFGATLALRATDDLWPAPESVHPFLGWALQKSLGMPGTDAGRAQQQSSALLGGLAARSATLLLTAADHDTSGPLRLTELARELSFSTVGAETLLTPAPSPLTVSLETAFDEAPLPTLPSNRIAGGARVLELQANCGFRAFASLRLNAAVPESRNLGGDPRDAGQDLHKTLEVFWQKLGSQRALRALSPTGRQAAVAAAVEAALELRRRAQPDADGWTEAYFDVAKRRLVHLTLRWLETELLRGDFTVLQQEEKQLISVGPLELSVRPDRIDEVDGGLVFVDYKTSQALSAENWLGERPLAPQLPLYALLAQPEEVRGLAFGRVRAGADMGWISLQSEAGLFPKKGSANAADLAEQVGLWRTELTRLAEEFAAGVVSVDPKSYPRTCEFCQQRLLCRLNPETLLTTTTEECDSPEQEDDPAR